MTQRLLSLAVREWPEYHGSMLNAGARPLEWPFPWLLDSIYAWATAGATLEDRQMFDMKLHEPPPNYTPDVTDEVWGDEATFESFMGMAQTMRGRR